MFKTHIVRDTRAFAQLRRPAQAAQRQTHPFLRSFHGELKPITDKAIACSRILAELDEA